LFAAHFSSNALFDLMSTVFRRGSDSLGRYELLNRLADQLKDDMRVSPLIREAATAATKDSNRDVRLGALQVLAYGRRDEPATWQLMRVAATKDPALNVRQRACLLLFLYFPSSELQRRLMSQDLEEFPLWAYPWLWRQSPFVGGQAKFLRDPKEPITSEHVAYVAKRLKLNVDEVRRQYETVAATLQIELDMEWPRQR
jgi:hypothetical protein